MIRSELLQAIAADNPELRPEEVEQVVTIFFPTRAPHCSRGCPPPARPAPGGAP
jgi:integration host factor subunit beta